MDTQEDIKPTSLADYSTDLASQIAADIAEQKRYEEELELEKQAEAEMERGFNHRMSWSILIISFLSLLVGIASIMISLFYQTGL